ncbi:MAG: diphthine synthase [Nanoarchaeota archaeon]
MALYIIGIGLFDEKDITIKGLEAVKKSKYVYLENYTSKFDSSLERLEKFYEKKIIVADREMVESKADEIIDNAIFNDVSFLVIGDPFCATTHIDLRLRAIEKNVQVNIINNASIINSIAITGLDIYKFGRITTIPFDNKNIISPINVIKDNLSLGLSTLVLLDIDSENEKYMTINQAIDYLIENGFDRETYIVGCCAIGSDNPIIKYGKIDELKSYNFNLFLQCLIVPGKMHFMEEEILKKLSKKN